MKIVTIEDLRRHALDVWGKDDGIEWIEEMRMPTANHETGTLLLHPIKSEAAYAIALHEIGHLRQERHDDVLVEERRAWDWARDNALIWTPTMELVAERSIRDYETGDDEGAKAAFYYDQILECVTDLLVGGSPNGEQVYDALIRNAAELAELYENYDRKAARWVLMDLIDKYLPAPIEMTAHKQASR
jgi:hypothetical protein